MWSCFFTLQGIFNKFEGIKLDQAIVIGYLLVVLVVGLLVGRNTKTIDDFAVGKRNFSTFVLFVSVFASVIDGSATLGLAETVFSHGHIYFLSYLGIIISYLSLAIFIAPRLDSFLGLISPGDIMGKLYGKQAKIFMGFATVFESTLLTGVQIMATVHICQYFFNIPAQIAAYGCSIIILLYSLRGGIRAVTATDVFQFGILIIAIPIVCGIGLSKIGGIEGLINAIQSEPYKQPEPFDALKHAAIFISFAIPAIFPLTIQRILMAKNTQQIKRTFITNACISAPFYLCVTIIGIVACLLVPEVSPNFAFPALIESLLPVGVKGFVIAGLLAVFMSSIDSDLNVASVAITHDIFTPFAKGEISEKTKLKIARISCTAISLLAAVSALCFDSIFGMMYFVMCVSNSAFFPGYLMGFLGFKPSTKGFWIGLSAATCSVFFFSFVVGLFELYTGIISILINISILLYFHYSLKDKDSRKDELNFKKVSLRNKIEPIFNLEIKRHSYCNVFAMFTIINSVCPFFLLNANLSFSGSHFLLIYLLSAVLSFLILFKEVWWSKALKLFPFTWHLCLMIALPCTTFLMFLQTDFSLIWFMDILVSTALLSLIVHRNMVIVVTMLGIIFSSLLHAVFGFSIQENIITIGTCSLASHVITLVFCLLLFRKQDVEIYQFLSGKLAHEASRSLSSLSASSSFLQSKIPILLRAYENAEKQNIIEDTLSKDEITQLKDLPVKLSAMGKRTSKTLSSLLSRIYPDSYGENTLEITDILSLVEDALSDPSISEEQRKIIKVNHQHNFFFIANSSQISQAILNLVENALFAVRDVPYGNVEIWANDSSLFIKDNGHGISKKDLPNIYDDFFSTKKTMGQGLSFCKQIMMEHTGEIFCKSEEQLFTQFELRFNCIEMLPKNLLHYPRRESLA